MVDHCADPYDVNRMWWDECAGFHLDTPLYQGYVERLAEGGHSLLPLEVREVGDVNGLDVLHLQCHVGTDTLSLARLGATVTGVDFSPVAIREATALGKRLGIEAQFVEAEIAEIGEIFNGQFDLVFTSYGVITWLSDLGTWARNIAQALRPGGRLYIAEMHPLAFGLDEEWEPETGIPRLRYPYLAGDAPLEFTEDGTYADPSRKMTTRTTREWSWGLGDVVGAILDAGLDLLWLREHPEGFYPTIPGMVRGDDGHYRLPPPLHGMYPMTFSLMAAHRDPQDG